jgi:predicted metalloprotease with PDZ domain
MTIHYQITPLTAAHIYQVKLTFIAIDAKQQLSLPVWIPGSYMVREFSKNIIQLSASSQHKEILAEQITKNLR